MGRKRSDIADDGYVWHKYGSKNVRGRMVGYFKCTHVGCASRKKVWRQANGDEVVERDGTHAHVAPGGRYEYVGEVSMHDDEEDEVPVPVNVAARGGALEQRTPGGEATSGDGSDESTTAESGVMMTRPDVTPLASAGVALLLPSCCTLEVSLQLVMLLVRHVGHPCVGVTFAFQRRVSSSSSNAGSFTRDLFLQILLGEEPGAHTLSCSSTKALLYCDVCILYSSARLFGPHNRRTTLLRTRVLCFLFVSPRVS